MFQKFDIGDGYGLPVRLGRALRAGVGEAKIWVSLRAAFENGPIFGKL
jgi:hypothetical protein